VQLNLHNKDVNSSHTPYCSGYLIDTIPKLQYSPETKEKLIKKMQFLIGSLNWIAISTRLDIATMVALLSQYTHNPYIDAAI